MSRKPDNPSAFPDYWQSTTEGMTLRDYFAAKAMQGLVAASGDSAGEINYDDEAISKSAYLLADSMLKARETK